MTLAHFLEEKFEYDLQANLAWIHLLQKQDDASEYSLKTLSHIINVHHIWMSRLLGKPAESNVWDILPLMYMERLAQVNFLETQSYFQYDLESELIAYSDSEGKQKEKENLAILYHILNHSNYHRGQISLDRKREGLEIVETNFIVFK